MIPYLVYYAEQLRYDDFYRSVGLLPENRSMPGTLPVTGQHHGVKPSLPVRAYARSLCAAPAAVRAFRQKRSGQAHPPVRASGPVFGDGR